MPEGEPRANLLPDDAVTRIESIAARFEDAQQRGEAPRIEAFLPAEPAVRELILVELLHADLEFRLKAGEAARVEEYVARFPELADWPEVLHELIASECQFRRRREPGVSIAEYLDRFPQFRDELPKRLSPAEGESANDKPFAVTLPAEPGLQARVASEPVFYHPRMIGFEILGELGRGGMGVVYKAREPKRGQIVALKTLQWVDPTALYRFKQEFRALADVNHPNLVALHELVSDGDRWFFTMELVDGVDFFTYLRPPTDEPPAAEDAIGQVGHPKPAPTPPQGLSRLQLRKLRAALIQLTQGLLALHEAGKLHRDVKPRNVLVTEEGRVVLLDFGLAADLGRGGVHFSSERHIIGTLSYMSPEQAEALPLSPPTDWFSVGVMLYEALTGQLPKLDRSPLPPDMRRPLRAPVGLKPPLELAPETPDDLNEICLALLQTDPAARLTGAELLRLLQENAPAIDSTVVPASLLQPATPFIGREEQLQTLQAAFASVQAGTTEVVFVHGRSGAGKSALIQRFLDPLEADPKTVVLAGRCYERESVPYKALDSVIDSLSRYLRRLAPHESQAILPRNVLSLARVFPVLRRVEAIGRSNERIIDTPDPQEVRRRAFSALRELLARLGDRKRLVLYIDDLQWGDIDSAELMIELLRPPDPPTMLLLGCYRAEDATASSLLAKLRDASENVAALAKRREVALDTLSRHEAQELALLLLGEDSPLAAEQAAAVARESRGNPYFVQELVQYVKGGSGLADRPSTTGEIQLERVLWERVQRLPDDARRLLEVLAVAGQPLKSSQAGLAAQAASESRSAISVLRSGHLIRATGAADDSQIEPYHDRIRQTIVAHLSPERLREHHLRLAQTLAAAGDADPEMLAIHYQGADEFEQAGAHFAVAATHASEALAFEHASRLFRLALKLRPVSGEEERRLVSRLADALANAGRGAEAAQEFLRAAATADKRESLAWQRKAAEQYMVSGHIDDGLRVLGGVLAAVGLQFPGSPRRALVSLLVNRARLWLRGRRFQERSVAQIPPEEMMRIDACWSVTAGLSMVDTIRGADFQTRHFLYALAAGEPARVARAMAFEAGHLASEGGRRAKQAGELLHEAEELAQRVGTPQARATALAARGIVAALLGRWPEARDCSDQAEVLFREQCTGVAWELGTVHRFAYWARIFMGEIREVSLRLPVLLKDARERNDLYAVTNLNNTVLPMIYLAADDPDRIQAEVYSSEPPPRKDYHVPHYVRLFDLAQTDMYCGRGRVARERIEAQWPRLAGSFLLRVQQIRIFMVYVRGRAALMAAREMPDEKQRLLSAAQADANRLTREQIPWAAGLGKLLAACVAAARGDEERAARQFARAAELLDTVSMGLHAAAARHRQGVLLGGEAGRRLIDQAETWMTAQTVKNPERMTNMLAPS